MPLDAAFAPHRLAPGLAPAEALRRAAEAEAAPAVVELGERLARDLAGRSLASVPAGEAASPDEACRAADGSPSGGPDSPRACLSSARHCDEVAEYAGAAVAAGYAGILLDRPDAPLALGLLGAGFCPRCQDAFLSELRGEYGDQLEPLDYAASAREALASASGALGYEQLPFGREFWRFRHDQVAGAVRDHTRAARDRARAAGHALDVAARFETSGPAAFAAARQLDAAVFPAEVPSHATGAGTFRLLRAVMGRRPCAAELPAATPSEALPRFAGVAAACGVEIAGHAGEDGLALASIRRFARSLSARRDAPSPHSPAMECAVLYSSECDLWTGGLHRRAVEEAVEALSRLYVQAPVVLRPSEAAPEATLVLAGARALTPLDAQAIHKRIEGGGTALLFGEAASVDAAGRPVQEVLPEGKPAGTRVGRGTVAALPALVHNPASGLAPGPSSLEPISRALGVLLGKGRRAASVVTRTPVQVALYERSGQVEAHLASLSGEAVRGATLFIGVHVAGAARRARFLSAEGADERIAMNPSGYSISTVLPAFRGYAVLSVG